ncbi:MAG TPA: hypothetical protein VFX39_08465 [Gemmatimonadaceae bacterium]|nr:hypothetical protein [Gemmatimonadaceae bacterium]
MLVPAPLPHALATPVFPFPALTALAARSALGATRETVLACLLGARLAVATLAPYRLSAEPRARRAAAAVAWLAALTLPDAMRPALAHLFEAAAGAPATELGAALLEVRRVAAEALDVQSCAELLEVVRRLDPGLAPAGDTGA